MTSKLPKIDLFSDILAEGGFFVRLPESQMFFDRIASMISCWLPIWYLLLLVDAFLTKLDGPVRAHQPQAIDALRNLVGLPALNSSFQQQ